MQRSSIHLLCISQRHGSWNQKSQIWTHQTKGQISTGLMSIARVSWPKQVSLLLLVSFSRGFFAAIRPRRPDSCSLLWTVDVEMRLLLELCEAFTWVAIWGAVNWQFLRLATLINLSSAVEVTLVLPFLRRSSWEPFSSSHLMVFATALEETFIVLEIFWIDWHSFLKVMMDCRFSLLSWVVLAIIWMIAVQTK